MSASYSYIQPGVTDAVPSLCKWFAPRRVLLRSSFWCYLLPSIRFNTSSLDVLEGSSVIPNQKEDHAGSWKERFKNTLR